MVGGLDESLASGFRLYAHGRVRSSRDLVIHNLDSPRNQHRWETGRHSKKRFRPFLSPVFRESIAIVDVNGGSLEYVEQLLNPEKLVYESTA